MRNLFAKLIATIMLGTMLLGAASAQTAEKEWRWVSYPSIRAYGELITADLDALCVIVVQANAESSGSAREYLGTYEVISDMVYCHHKILPSYFSRAQMRPYCLFGGVWNPTRPEGCYELKEATENCHVVGTSQGYPVCGEESVNGSLCDEITPLEDQAGGIACNGTDSSICFWDHPLEEYEDTEARKAIKECMIGHEKNHKDDKNMRCIIEDNKEVGQFGNKDDALLAQSEQNAYRAEVKCLRGKMDEDKENVCANSKTPALCNSELKKVIDKQREKLAFYSMWLIKNEVRK